MKQCKGHFSFSPKLLLFLIFGSIALLVIAVITFPTKTGMADIDLKVKAAMQLVSEESGCNPEDFRLTNDGYIARGNFFPYQVELTRQQAATAFNEMLKPVWDNIINYYPVPYVREKSLELALGAETIKYAMDVRVVLTERWFAKVTTTTDNKPLVLLNMATIMAYKKMLDSTLNQEQAEKRFEDKMAIVLLHELYHLEHHARLLPNLYPEEFTRTEAECWADSCEHVIQPMVEVGRGLHPCEIESKINFIYHHLALDDKNPAWLHVISTFATNVH